MGLKTEKIIVNGKEYDLTSTGGSDIDIVDNLETADSTSALSANQGKVLNEKIEEIESQSVVADYDEENKILDLEFNVPVQGIIEDTLESDNSYNALSAKQGKVLNEKITSVEIVANEATDIAKGRNKARVFATTEDMNEWLSDEANKGIANIGDNLYIVDTNVPDWWISEVLTEANADGKYYEVAQLETQKVDLTTINTAISDLQDDVSEINSNLSRKGVVFLANCTQQTDTTYTVISLKSFDLLLLTVGYMGKQSRGTVIIPTIHFINSGYINAQFYNEVTGEHVNADCTYISDTSVLIKTTHANQHGTLYGIKL